MTIVLSQRDAECLAPPGAADRRYLVAPLTHRDRQACRANLARKGGIYPSHAQMLHALRAAVSEASPDNVNELLAMIDTSEATPDDAAMQVQVGTIEAACATVPVYAGPLTARHRYLVAPPSVAARHALRGCEGDGLPLFRRARSPIPEDLPEVLPQEDVEAVGWRAETSCSPGRETWQNLATETIGRICFAIESGLAYCDVTVGRWQELTGQAVVLDAEDRTFDDIAAARGVQAAA